MKEEDEKSYLNADSAILKIGSRPLYWLYHRFMIRPSFIQIQILKMYMQ